MFYAPDRNSGVTAVNESLHCKVGQNLPTGANQIFKAKLFDILI